VDAARVGVEGQSGRRLQPDQYAGAMREQRLSGNSDIIPFTPGEFVISRPVTAVALAVLAGCSGSSPTSPPAGGGGTGDNSGGGGGDGGSAPLTAAVTVGNNFFKSGHNGSANLAIDTVAVGGTVTWTWASTGSVPHSVQSLGLTIFRNSTVETGDGSTYQVTFKRPGTYQYDCEIHGSLMTGTIVVR
jgi:plastocyanin